MIDFSKKTETKRFFDCITDDLKKAKVKAVFYLSSLSYHNHSGYRIYDTDDEVYILLENGYCLVITYPFIDSLDVQFRQMTSTEQQKYRNSKNKDLFNNIVDLYDNYTKSVIQTETIQLEYGIIEKVLLRSVTDEYDKWVDNDIDRVSPNKETFDEIKFMMSNGKSFVICADNAQSDGYVLFWSEDAVETITKKEL